MRAARHGAIVVGLLLAAATPARADWNSGASSNCGNACGVATGLIIGIVDVVFLSADLAYGVRGRTLPAGWAWGQTIWGGGNLFAGIVLTPLGAVMEQKTLLGLGITFGVLGSWFFVHGIVSLVRHYRAPRRYALSEGPPRHLPEVSFAPSAGGGFGALRWSF